MTDTERSPPPSPTPLDFPQSIPRPQSHDLTQDLLHDVKGILLGLRNPGDVRREHLEALNVKVTSGVLIQDLLPKRGQKQPSVEAEQDASKEPPCLSNGNPPPTQDKYDVLERELQFDNHEAFRELLRLEPLPGRKRLRITQTRKFWAGLEKMSSYWDTSADRYYERPAGAKRAKLEDTRSPLGSEKNDKIEIETPEPCDPDSAETKLGSRTRYKGRRLANGSKMPEELREETVRAFVEMVAWAFGCQVNMPTAPPRLAVNGIIFPVRQSFAVNRSPADRMLARRGHMEGPLFAIQCKNEISFRSAEDRIGDGSGEAADLFREVGALLLTAQERARQGKVENVAGIGKWWTTSPRWGGGAGGDPEIPEEGSVIAPDEPPPPPRPASSSSSLSSPTAEKDKRAQPRRSTDMDPAFRARSEKRLSRRGGVPVSTAAKRLGLIEKWKILKPSSRTWNEKLKYLQIGKMKHDPFDDIYLVSALNHHISIVHLRVHPGYLSWLSGDCELESTNDESARTLHLQRTRWYDLFNTEDRLEALKATWSICEWMMRGGEETGELKDNIASTPTTILKPNTHAEAMLSTASFDSHRPIPTSSVRPSD